MSDLNNVTLVGRLGADPELRHLQNGQAVCRLSVATSRRWHDKSSGSMKEETEWHRVTVWGKQADTCNSYLAKGREVWVVGRLKTSEYTDRSGNKRRSTEVVADRVGFLGSKGGQAQQGNPFPADDNIPF